jgi:hypothetical protein
VGREKEEKEKEKEKKERIKKEKERKKKIFRFSLPYPYTGTYWTLSWTCWTHHPSPAIRSPSLSPKDKELYFLAV